VTGELLLELLSEEIPARMQRRAIEDLVGLLRDKLAAADISATTIEGQVTPRRLVVIADGIPMRQPDREEERRGPRVGAPEAALGGFLRAAKLQSIDQCEVRATERGEFYFAILKQPGRATAAVLPELILAAMTALPWPKSMRYPASGLRWVRPLNSVVCLFDGEVLGLPLGEVPVGRVTRGHRFLSPDEISVTNVADYRAQLAAAHVVLDRAERRAIIERDLAKLAAAEGLAVKPDEGLLEEVTGLVEHPVVLMGSIDADFVRPLPEGLPPEVLATAMRTHQKYFSCLNPDGTPAPRFLFVANNVTPDAGKTIAAGNERVLRARLSDARFFWDQDRKIRLEDRVEALKQRIYHEKLGSVYDKIERMGRLAEFVALGMNASHTSCRRAAHLAKADLSTGMVGEFPELQGVMGRYYALNDGEDPRVADAIADHYKPLGPNDTCPSRRESIIAALADKLDALAGFFAIGERPTGSGDPYALRRAAQGVIRIILENGLRVSLTNIQGRAVEIVSSEIGETRPEAVGKIVQSLMYFYGDRLTVHLRGQGVRHDLISAVFNLKEDDLVRLIARVAALRTFLNTEDGENLLVAYRRAANIVAIEERRDQQNYYPDVDRRLLREPVEHALMADLELTAEGSQSCLDREEFDAAMGHLASMRRSVDEFFDKVTVNVDDKELRENRLRLLARIRATMNQIADFSQIEG
jgi:glycyl-tRNA synthetase beta chain